MREKDFFFVNRQTFFGSWMLKNFVATIMTIVKERMSGAAANRQIFNRHIYTLGDSTWQVQLLYFLFLQIQLLNIFQSELFFFGYSLKKITNWHWEKFINDFFCCKNLTEIYLTIIAIFYSKHCHKSTLEFLYMFFGNAMKFFMMVFLRRY